MTYMPSDHRRSNQHHQTCAQKSTDQSKMPSSATHFHTHSVGPNECSSTVVQTISAPIQTVWAVVRQFDNPQSYKHFIKSCHVITPTVNAVGSLREVRLISGIPAVSSMERLEIFDDDEHVLSFRVVGGEHRLTNYRSVTTLHKCGDDTAVVESYVADVPEGNSKEDTCMFVDTIVKCNLQSLAQTVEKIAKESESRVAIL